MGAGLGPTGPTGAVVGTSSVSLTVQVQDPQAGPMFYMAERDWDRFGEYLQDLGSALPPIHDRYVRFEAMAVGGGIGFLGWLGVVATGVPMNIFVAVIGFVLLAGTLAAAGIAWSNRGTEQFLEKKIRRDSDLLWDDMNRTHAFGGSPASTAARAEGDELIPYVAPDKSSK